MPDGDIHPAGTLIRLKSDPARQGVLTGKYREQAGIRKYQVAFPEVKTYQPEYELDVISAIYVKCLSTRHHSTHGGNINHDIVRGLKAYGDP